MNERIRELCLQTMTEDSVEKWLTQEEFMERYAELIVLECAHVAGLKTPATEELNWGNLISDKIKEHFGVD